jgi:hypothetical protein
MCAHSEDCGHSHSCKYGKDCRAKCGDCAAWDLAAWDGKKRRLDRQGDVLMDIANGRVPEHVLRLAIALAKAL